MVIHKYHRIYILVLLKTSNWDDTWEQKITFSIIKRGKEIVDRNSKSKWKEVFSYLLSQLQIYNKGDYFCPME